MRDITKYSKTIIALFLLLIFGITMTLIGNMRISKVAAASGSGMCVMEKTSMRILNSSNMHAKLPMASTTKIVTAITVIENTPDLNKVVTVPDASIGVEGSSIYLVKDEQLKVIDLLYGLMLQSGNDSAVALAIVTGGSVENFAKMMNETALRVGAQNSNFVNPHGLHDDNHYTTAYDLAKISCYAMQNSIFAKIVGTKTYRTTWKDRDYGRVINNKNKILSQYKGGTGVKTGFTKRAGRCLVASSERDGMEVVAVVLNYGDMFGACKNLMTVAHNEYSMVRLAGRDTAVGVANVENSYKNSISLGTKESLFYPLKDGEKGGVSVRLRTKNFKAPVFVGEEAGEAEILFNKQLLFTAKVFTIEEAGSKSEKDRLRDFVYENNFS